MTLTDAVKIAYPTDHVVAGPITYPARPINGGEYDPAISKPGRWAYEPKYNGWRVLVHAPSRTCWNRHGGALSIASEFKHALWQLALTAELYPGFEWLDCEGLSRRHAIGKGTLLVLDAPSLARLEYTDRYRRIAERFATHNILRLPENNAVYAVHSQCHDLEGFWQALRDANANFGVEFYEGFVAKRIDSPYPCQLRHPDEKCKAWVKHRFI